MTAHPLRAAVTVVAAALLLPPSEARAQNGHNALPFGPGEELVYRLSTNRFGDIGSGSLRVQPADPVRGHAVYRLHFEIEGGIGPLKLEDRTCSWVEPDGLTTLRYRKRERSPITSKTEELEFFPAERRWLSGAGRRGPMPTDEPLDELSFIYFIRTLPLETGDVYRVDRHFDTQRNPVTIRVLRREEVPVVAGIFASIVVEMRVRDPGRYGGGEGVLLLHLTDDAHRYPVRIQTAMPLAGTLVLELEGATPGDVGR